ncbi:unnamed protein product [Effrenium voratum]|nr:unnamed protein product [Effrenium voratum]
MSPIGSIGARRLQLSGGQRRLLVLARLLLRRRSAHLVLLDEPFAGMEQSEVTPLHSMLKQQLAHAALMAVTHRLLPILHFFSRILVFEKGCCVQEMLHQQSCWRSRDMCSSSFCRRPAASRATWSA